ncbi:hypothetical protein N752_00790 [Desulforamulus aquiferis]|nr:hypothetical protein [Desulforamulus aquiferis]RYD07151.1 hypothetical protein N752_00790 [Desulforamulus aquiferis]
MASLLKWLSPGMRIKRWLTLAVAGIALLGLGLALLDRHLIGLMDDTMELLANQLGGFPLWFLELFVRCWAYL